MFDISTVSKRYFGIKLIATDEDDKAHSIELEVEPPKIKALKSLMAVSKAANEDAMNELAESVRKMLSKNKSGYKVPIEYIDDLNYDQLQDIMTEYFGWMAKAKNDPN